MARNFGLLEDTFPSLAVHAPMNDHVFAYRQDRSITASSVEAMLTTILQGKAVSGQIFGDEAPKLEHFEAQKGGQRHDEL
jgi:hypothetical protein